ncbi:unnamed protein product [Rhizoctonia solani]|uniref:Uncharacterized protein n=1 Tax=Rhizoctonia solani TaxID=456999 RepID=A0A8H3BXM5_9AGAM|nr:unnamed protein product [Rhizoctonia solani]CAE6469077.1 unnamed protein product [Rhizoctonia solani]
MQLLVKPQINLDPTIYRPKLLAIAALCSFISGTWVATKPHSMFAGWGWNKRWTFSIIMAVLSHTVFFLIFIPKVVLEWRFDIPISKRVERVCIGLALCAQVATIILENVANPYGKIWSSWGAISIMSIVSLIALNIYFLLPVIPGIWRILMIIVLPERLRKPNSLETSYSEPPQPAYSDHPTGNLEAQEGATGREILIDFDSVAVQSSPDGLGQARKGKNVTLTGEDLERGTVGTSV